MHNLPAFPLLLTVRSYLSHVSFYQAGVLVEISIELWRSALLVIQVFHCEITHSTTLRVWHTNLVLLHLMTVLGLVVALVRLIQSTLQLIYWIQWLNSSSKGC